MRILYVTSKPVYPTIDGGCVAMASFLDLLLRSGMEVDHLTISTEKHPFDASNYPVAIREAVNPVGVHIDTRIKPFPALKYLFAKGSYNVQRFHSDKMCRTISAMLNTNEFDIIILDSLYATTYIDLIREQFNGKIFMRSHNSEAKIWYDLASNETSLPKIAYLKKLAKDLESYERKVLEQIDGVMALSPDDLRLFNKMAPNVRGCIVPVTLDVPDISADPQKLSVFHLGSMEWTPNKDAVDELIGFFPEIRAQLPDVELHIAGTSARKYFKTKKAKGITVHGYVKNLNEFCADSGIMISPIRSGSGVRIKILEMMALGVPVITTPTGAMGIYPEGLKHLILAESRKGMVDTAIELLPDAQRRKEIGEKSRDYIREFHNIESASQELIEFLEKT